MDILLCYCSAQLAETIFTIYPGGSVSNGKIALLDNNYVGDVEEALIEEETLIEEISIDGMCGVY